MVVLAVRRTASIVPSWITVPAFSSTRDCGSSMVPPATQQCRRGNRMATTGSGVVSARAWLPLARQALTMAIPCSTAPVGLLRALAANSPSPMLRLFICTGLAELGFPSRKWGAYPNPWSGPCTTSGLFAEPSTMCGSRLLWTGASSRAITVRTAPPMSGGPTSTDPPGPAKSAVGVVRSRLSAPAVGLLMTLGPAP